MPFSSSFQHLRFVLVRGGRMTKVAGVAASFAPQPAQKYGALWDRMSSTR